jgi:hypothetical protein
MIAHQSDYDRLKAIPNYAPDFVFAYPADSVVLYPCQAILIGQLVSYFWGLQKKKISDLIERWNQPFVDFLRQVEPEASTLANGLRLQVEQHAGNVLREFLDVCEIRPYFDKLEGKRKMAIIRALSLLADTHEPFIHQYSYATKGFLGGQREEICGLENYLPTEPLENATFLNVLKDLALELSNTQQSKLLADHFLVDATGYTSPNQVALERPKNRKRTMYEYDYLIEYEGVGTFYDVEPVHPPKIAKAKKGWL